MALVLWTVTGHGLARSSGRRLDNKKLNIKVTTYGNSQGQVYPTGDNFHRGFAVNPLNLN